MMTDRQRRSKQQQVYFYLWILIGLIVLAVIALNAFAVLSILVSAFLGWHIFYLSYEARYGIKPFADATKPRTHD